MGNVSRSGIHEVYLNSEASATPPPSPGCRGPWPPLKLELLHQVIGFMVFTMNFLSTRRPTKERIIHEESSRQMLRVIPCTVALSALALNPLIIPPATAASWGFVEVPGQSREFKGFSSIDPDNSTDSFSVLGTVVKKYVIENLNGEKIVSRQKGFTVNSCVLTLSGAEEDSYGTPFQSLFSNSEKISFAESEGIKEVCVRSTGPELKSVCQSSCEASCASSISDYKEGVSRSSGLDLEEASVKRLIKSCQRDCKSECNKSGKISEWTEVSRR